MVAAAAVVLRMVVAVLHPNVLWPDEIFQSLEQAHRLVFGIGVVPWEFREGVRSWVLPALLAGPMALAPADGGLIHVRAAQIALSLLSLAPLAVAYLVAARARGSIAGLVAAVGVATWYELVLFAPKALAEVVSGHLLIVGLYLDRESPRRARFAAGALLGAAVLLRVHLLPAVVLAVAVSAGWKARRWASLLPGATVAAVLVGAVDLATWGTPFHSIIENFRQNVLQHRANEFGVAPWSGYFQAIWATWSWGTFALVPLALLGARRHPPLAAAAMGVIATHMLFAHKEYRFIYPALAIVVTLASVGMTEAAALPGRSRAFVAWVTAATLLAWTGVSAARATRYETTIVDPSSPPGQLRWTQGRWGVEAMALAGEKQDLCGVGLVLLKWAWTGGYTYLHRHVPIFPIEYERDGPMTVGGFNAVIAPAEVIHNFREFTVRRCWREGVCLAERPGGCRAVPGVTINERIASRGE